MNQGYSKRKAMIEAGYALSYASTSSPKEFLSSPGVRATLMGMKDALVNAGLTREYMAQVILQATQADKYIISHTEGDHVVPDHDVRLKASKEWREYMTMKDSEDPTRIKKKVEFTEYFDDIKKEAETIEEEKNS